MVEEEEEEEEVMEEFLLVEQLTMAPVWMKLSFSMLTSCPRARLNKLPRQGIFSKPSGNKNL